MSDPFFVTCPYCGEEVEIYLEADDSGSFVQDLRGVLTTVSASVSAC